MKKFKVRVFGMGIDAKALIPFPYEPTLEMIENAVAEYLNEGLMIYHNWLLNSTYWQEQINGPTKKS